MSNKGKKRRESNQPKEEIPKDQAAEAEGKPELRTEEKPSKSSGKTKDELWDECVMLQQELKSVQKQKKGFKIQRDNAQRSWDNSRRNLEEAKERMREKLRLQQEAQQRHREEIEEQEQKLKQLETSHNCEICELKMATVARNSKIQEQHQERVSELQEKVRTLKAERREKKQHKQIAVEHLKLKQHEELRQLKNGYVEQEREIEAQYIKKMKIMVEENRKKTDKELAEIDKRMKKRTKSVIKECDQALEKFKEKVAEEKKHHEEALQLRKELEKTKKEDAQLDRKITAATAENKRLTEAVSNMEVKVREKNQELDLQRKAKAKSLKKSRKSNERMEEEKREVLLKVCQLETKYEQLLQERDQMEKRLTEMTLQVQQKSGLKDMLTESKIAVLSETLEKEQLKLWVALTFIKGDQTAAQNIKELFESKQAIIKALREDISRDLKEYNELAGKVTGSDTSAHENTSEDEELSTLMEELTALCISEDDSGQQDEQGLNPAVPSPDHEVLQLSGPSGWP